MFKFQVAGMLQEIAKEADDIHQYYYHDGGSIEFTLNELVDLRDMMDGAIAFIRKEKPEVIK